MIALGQHWQFIAASYAGSFILIGALIVWTVVEARRAQARVAALEADRDRKRAKQAQ